MQQLLSDMWEISARSVCTLIIDALVDFVSPML